MRRTVAVLLTVLAAGATMTLGSAGPAHAATPTCSQSHEFPGRVYYGDGAYWAKFFMPAYYTGGGYTFSCILREGIRNHDGVRTLQYTLNACWGDVIGVPLSVDGNYGPKTKAAVLAVQKQYPIGWDGIYGPETARTIRHWAYVTSLGIYDCERWQS